MSEEAPAVAAAPESMVQLWARFLAARSAQERHKLAQENPIMATASETLERISEDPDLVRRAEERELSLYFYESSIARAEERGRQEGLFEGKQEGLLEALLLLLRKKYGEVPEAVHQQALRGTHRDVTRWTERVLSAAHIEDVFAE